VNKQNENKDKERIVFDAIVSNPPYQVTKNGNNTQIWQHFVKVANLCGAKWVSMIHPARWLNAERHESDKENIINSGLEKFEYYENSSDLFPNTGINAGISITNFKKDYKGKTGCYINNQKTEYDPEKKFAKNTEEIELHNVLDSYTSFMDKYLIKGKVEFNKKDLNKDKKSIKSPIKVWTNIGTGKGSKNEWYFIDKNNIKVDNTILVNKVMVSITGHHEKGDMFSGLPEIVDKNSVSTHHFFFKPENDTAYELELIKSLLMTKTARALMGFTQKNFHTDGFENIPDYTLFIKDLNSSQYNNDKFIDKDGSKKGLFTDEFFYSKFSFSQDLIDYIENNISSKELV